MGVIQGSINQGIGTVGAIAGIAKKVGQEAKQAEFENKVKTAELEAAETELKTEQRENVLQHAEKVSDFYTSGATKKEVSAMPDMYKNEAKESLTKAINELNIANKEEKEALLAVGFETIDANIDLKSAQGLKDKNEIALQKARQAMNSELNRLFKTNARVRATQNILAVRKEGIK